MVISLQENYDFSIFNKNFLFLLKILIFQISFAASICSIQNPFYKEGECVHKCGLETIITVDQKYRCVAGCQQFKDNKTHIVSNEQQIFYTMCTDSCPLFVSQTKYCQSYCTFFAEKVQNQLFCSDGCASNISEIRENIYFCVESCAEKYLNESLISSQICQSTCPYFVEQQNSFSYCRNSCKNQIFATINSSKNCQTSCNHYLLQFNFSAQFECVDSCPSRIHAGFVCLNQCLGFLEESSNGHYQCTADFCPIVFESESNIFVCKDKCDTFYNHSRVQTFAQLVCQNQCNFFVNRPNVCVSFCDPKLFSISNGLKYCELSCFNNFNDELEHFECVENCSFMYFENKTCVDQCPDLWFHDGQVCVESCELKYFEVVDGVRMCVSECERLVIKYTEDKIQCVDACENRFRENSEECVCISRKWNNENCLPVLTAGEISAIVISIVIVFVASGILIYYFVAKKRKEGEVIKKKFPQKEEMRTTSTKRNPNLLEREHIGFKQSTNAKIELAV